MNEEIELLENIIDERDDEISALKLQLQNLLSPPEQRPVAWHYIYDDGITVRERVTECMPLGEHYTITPLYTAPPKREPLSDEEVIAKYKDIALDNPLYVPSYYAGFRDAEQAHGITGGGGMSKEQLREDIREGISLRDHFAGLAMQGFLAADYNDWDYEKFALTSYEQADAMLAERAKRDV
jgi:hypothetical protein